MRFSWAKIIELWYTRRDMHDLIKSDLKRLVLTAVIAVAVVTLAAYAEKRFHTFSQLIKIPTSAVEQGSPSP